MIKHLPLLAFSKFNPLPGVLAKTHIQNTHQTIKAASKMVLSIVSCTNVYMLLCQRQRNPPKVRVKWAGKE